MKDNEIDVNQLEPIISDFATYCFKDNLSFDDFVQSARECLNLTYKLRISVQQIPEFIVQGKKMIDKLEEERQDILGEMQRIREERDKIIDEIEEYREERQLIEQIKVLSRELDKNKIRINSKEEQNILLKRQLTNARRASFALDEDNARLIGELSLCREENEKLKKDVAQLRGTRNNSFKPDLQSSGIRF
jgi:chromosome segregation ATPase